MVSEKILVVDDEEHIIELLKFNLENIGYKVLEANNGIDAIKIAQKERPNLILLDLMLPGIDGYKVCEEIRNSEVILDTPIIMITAKSQEVDKILGLELGADDYITKPFSINELIARVKALLRRSLKKIDCQDCLKVGDLFIHFEKHEVIKNSKKIELTLKEFELLGVLIKSKGKVLTRDFLLDKIWGYEYIGETRTVDVHIRHLRKKIEDDDRKPKYIETIRGVGYKFCYGD